MGASRVRLRFFLQFHSNQQSALDMYNLTGSYLECVGKRAEEAFVFLEEEEEWSCAKN